MNKYEQYQLNHQILSRKGLRLRTCQELRDLWEDRAIRRTGAFNYVRPRADMELTATELAAIASLPPFTWTRQNSSYPGIPPVYAWHPDCVVYDE